jgi:hypothetical protein
MSVRSKVSVELTAVGGCVVSIPNRKVYKNVSPTNLSDAHVASQEIPQRPSASSFLQISSEKLHIFGKSMACRPASVLHKS